MMISLMYINVSGFLLWCWQRATERTSICQGWSNPELHLCSNNCSFSWPKESNLQEIRANDWCRRDFRSQYTMFAGNFSHTVRKMKSNKLISSSSSFFYCYHWHPSSDNFQGSMDDAICLLYTGKEVVRICRTYKWRINTVPSRIC